MSTNNTHCLIDQRIQPVNNFFSAKRSVDMTQQQFNAQQQQFKNIERSKLKQWKAQNEGSLSQGSYQSILEQSLTTQDKPFLYQILTQTNPQIIRSSLEELSAKKVIDLLQMIKSLLQNNLKLGKGQDNSLAIVQWLQMLLKLHLSVIVGNPQNKQTVEAIRKLLTKRIQQRPILMQMRSRLIKKQRIQQEKKTYHPKFDYVEEEKDQIQEEGNDEMGDNGDDYMIDDQGEEGDFGFDDFEEDF